MIQRLISPPGCLNVNGQIALGLFLTGVVGQQFRPQAYLTGILGRKGGRHNGRHIKFLIEF